MTEAFRLVAVMTHPVQYYSPWFRFIENHVSELDFSVLYASEPDANQQGVGFGRAFMWDVPLKEGYRSEVIRASTPKDRFDSGSFWGLDVPELCEGVRNARPDAVLLSGWQSISLVRVIRFCLRQRIPLIYRGDTQLGGHGRGPKKWLWRARSRWLLQHFTSFLTVGIRARDYLGSFGIPEGRIFWSPHAVDNSFFASHADECRSSDGVLRARRHWDLEPDDYVVLFAGKLETKKRPQDLVRAVSTLRPSARLLVAGTGVLEGACRHAAEEAGTKVSWAGFLNQTELGKAYATADCLALPSGWGESWGLVVNEAMASGLPCVVSDRVGCAPDLIEEGRTGFTFSAAAIPELADALARVRELRQARRIRPEFCREKVGPYSYEAATEGLLAACRACRSTLPLALSWNNKARESLG